MLFMERMGFKRIKGFEKYAINADKVVINVKRNKVIKRNANGTVHLYNDIGDRHSNSVNKLFYMSFYDNYIEMFLKENDAKIIKYCSNYAINKKGEVFNLTHFTKLKGCIGGRDGYLYKKVTINDDCGTAVGRPISNLVAETFLEPVKYKYSVGFKDGDKFNCNLENLYWK